MVSRVFIKMLFWRSANDFLRFALFLVLGMRKPEGRVRKIKRKSN